MPEFALAGLHRQRPRAVSTGVDLPAPFGPHQDGALAAFRLEIQTAIHHDEIAVSVIHLFQGDHPRPAARRLRKRKWTVFFARDRRLNLSMRSICLSLLCACEALVALPPEAIREYLE